MKASTQLMERGDDFAGQGAAVDGAGRDLGLACGLGLVDLTGQELAGLGAQLAHRFDCYVGGYGAGADQFLHVALGVGQDEIVFNVGTAATDDGGDFGAVQAGAAEALEAASGLQRAQRGILVAGEDPRLAVDFVPLERDNGNPFNREAARDGSAVSVVPAMAIDQFDAGTIGERGHLERGKLAAAHDVGGQFFYCCLIEAVPIPQVEIGFYVDIPVAGFHRIGAFERAGVDHRLE